MNLEDPSLRRRLLALGVPLAALVASGILLGREIAQPQALRASQVPLANDPDGDGLVNAQEAVLGTNAYRADTDQDGYSDLEELARDSSPLFQQSVPGADRLHVGLSARGGGGMVHATLALYLPDGSLRGKAFDAGILVGNRVMSIPHQWLLDNARLSLQPTNSGTGALAVVDFPFTPRLVRAFGHLTVFATLRERSCSVVQAADSMHLLAFDTTVVLQMQNPMILGTGGLSGHGQQAGGTGSAGIGTIYVPLPVAGGSDPSTWTPGQVCVQQSVPVSVSGALVTQEVVSAECQEGWDGYCPPSCASTVGDTFTTIDPVALIGG